MPGARCPLESPPPGSINTPTPLTGHRTAHTLHAALQSTVQEMLAPPRPAGYCRHAPRSQPPLPARPDLHRAVLHPPHVLDRHRVYCTGDLHRVCARCWCVWCMVHMYGVSGEHSPAPGGHTTIGAGLGNSPAGGSWATRLATSRPVGCYWKLNTSPYI